MSKKTFLVVVDRAKNEVVEVVEGFKESKYTVATMRRLDIKIFWKRRQLIKNYPLETHDVVLARNADYASLAKTELERGVRGWEKIIPKLIDVVITDKLVGEIYAQIPVSERNELDMQAMVLGIRSKKNIRAYVVDIWLIRQRIGEIHESEK